MIRLNIFHDKCILWNVIRDWLQTMKFREILEFCILKYYTCTCRIIDKCIFVHPTYTLNSWKELEICSLWNRKKISFRCHQNHALERETHRGSCYHRSTSVSPWQSRFNQMLKHILLEIKLIIHGTFISILFKFFNTKTIILWIRNTKWFSV